MIFESEIKRKRVLVFIAFLIIRPLFLSQDLISVREHSSNTSFVNGGIEIIVISWCITVSAVISRGFAVSILLNVLVLIVIVVIVILIIVILVVIIVI